MSAAIDCGRSPSIDIVSDNGRETNLSVDIVGDNGRGTNLWIMSATIDKGENLSIDIVADIRPREACPSMTSASHNMLSPLSIDGHCQPQ